MIEVTSEAWAEFISQYRYICCGSGEDVLKIWDIPTRQPLGLVMYRAHGGQRYWINQQTTAKVIHVHQG